MTDQSTWPMQIRIKTDPKQLRKFGPFVPAWFNHPDATEISGAVGGYLLVDLGAGNIGIDEEVAKQLNLEVAGQQDAHGLHGRGNVNRYSARLLMPVKDAFGRDIVFGVPLEPMGIQDMRKNHAADGLVGPDGQPADAIGVLGRLFLQFVDLHYDGRAGTMDMFIHEEITRPQSA